MAATVHPLHVIPATTRAEGPIDVARILLACEMTDEASRALAITEAVIDVARIFAACGMTEAAARALALVPR